jgi:predicted DNA-binding transcriptional regulator AlpA
MTDITELCRTLQQTDGRIIMAADDFRAVMQLAALIGAAGRDTAAVDALLAQTRPAALPAPITTSEPVANDLMSIKALCSHMNITRQTLAKLRRDDTFPPEIRVSERKIMFSRPAVMQWLQSRSS